MLYAGAVFTAVMALCLGALGNWHAGLVGLGLASSIGMQPYLRREWYLVGYAEGYMDAAQAVMRDDDP